MNKYIVAFLLGCFSVNFVSVPLHAVCARCEAIREQNKKNSSNEFFYYEDYTEAQEKTAKQVE